MKMEDIARLAGVSRQTVSAVLNGKTWVSAETRARVLKMVEEHRYTPNQHAVSLVGRPSTLIGVILRDISNPFYSQVAMGIEEVVRKENYGLLYYNTFESHESEVRAIQALLSYNVAAAIISPVVIGVTLDHLWEFKQKGKVLASIDQIPGMQTHYVAFANEGAARNAVQHLIDNGHRRIGFLAGPESSSSNQARLMGYKSALVDNGIPVDPSLIIPAGTPPDERTAAARTILSLPKAKRPTALLCFNDLIAISVYKVAHELGLRIPNDVSVVGFDDIELAELLGPPLTTVRLNAREAGEQVARFVISAIKADPGAPPEKKVFTPELIERGSVRRVG